MTPANGVAPQLSIVIPTFNNVAVLTRCLDSWQTYASGEAIEIIVIEDGCRDDTPQYLTSVAATPWGVRHLRCIHETNVHELRATNRGLREARAPIVMTWHDDMFVCVPWLVRELLATFDRYPGIGMLCMSRGLTCAAYGEPIEKWDDVIDWRRLQSTIGPAPLNWFSLAEVDAVIRPWAIRRACLDRVGLLDEAFVPTGWDEADLAFRIREAGWKVAVHGYERVGAFKHLGSSTFAKYSLNLERDLQNARLFYRRWDDAIRRGSSRPRTSWWRPMTRGSWMHTLRMIGNYAVPSRRQAILKGEF
jgi:glycosyltransferase involved in cell wall biosynthesis